MTGMKQEFGYFLKNAKFRAALGLTLLLSYGYADSEKLVYNPVFSLRE